MSNLEGFALNLSDLLGGRDANEPKPASPPLLEVQLIELAEARKRYEAGCPFKVGDLVRPRKHCHVKWNDRPWMVVEVRKAEEPNFGTGDDGTPSYGGYMDIRCAVYSGSGSVSLFWNESFFFEPWLESENTSS